MLYQKLIYTAVTRAKKKLFLIGDFKALEYASQNVWDDIRRTTIKEYFIQGIKQRFFGILFLEVIDLKMIGKMLLGMSLGLGGALGYYYLRKHPDKIERIKDMGKKASCKMDKSMNTP